MNGGPLGVIGGTFDPIHYGHLRLAEEAAEALALAEVLWIPAGQPPHRAAPGAPAAHRLAMLRLAVTGRGGFSVDAGEIEAAQPSYTVPTLERLRRQHGARPLVLLLGGDAFAGLATWHRWRELFDLAHIAVATRPGIDLETAELPPLLRDELQRRGVADAAALAGAPAGGIHCFPMTPLAISATALRKRLTAGGSVRYLLPDAVVDYIHHHHLYVV